MNAPSFRIPLLVFIAAILSISTAFPCTTFVLRKDGRIIFGRNLDWITGTGLIMTNPRGLEKEALVDPSEKRIKWISRFGSVTFNQVGRDLPYGGINESGLVVEHMTLDETVYPSRDDRYAIGACQWIQFQLDNYSTVEEVMSSDTLVRIVDPVSRFHFLVCDRSGHVAAIEFLNGKMIVHTRDALPVDALANSTYEQSIRCYKENGDTKSNLSLYNFCTAAKGIQREDSFSADSAVNDAFNLLGAVSQGLNTKWSIVYDITGLKVYFKVFETPTIVGGQKIFLKHPGEAVVKEVDLREFSFDCRNAAKVLDLNSDHEGAVNRFFDDYSASINKEFIIKAFAFFKDWGIPVQLDDKAMDDLSRYPEAFRCAGGK